MPNWEGGSGTGYEGGGGVSGYDGGGDNDRDASYAGDWAGINEDIGRALAGGELDPFSPARGGYNASAPNVGNTQAISWQSHVGPDPGSFNDAGQPMGWQDNIGSMLGPGGNKAGFDQGYAKTAAKIATGILGPVAGSFIGLLVGLLTGTEYGGYLKSYPSGAVGLTSDIPKELLSDWDYPGANYEPAPSNLGEGEGGSEEFSYAGGSISGGGTSGRSEEQTPGTTPTGTGPTRGDFESYGYGIMTDDNLAERLVFGESEFTKSLF